MTRCAVYIRKSREDKNKPAHRLTIQREHLPTHARAQGWQVVVYDDGHASAAKGKTEDLRERARLEADVLTGRVQIILVIELSRLSRDDTLTDYLSWLNLCAEHGVKLATPSRILDPKQHSDWMLLLMEGGFSSVEMKILQARMEEGRAEAFRAGKWLGGHPPPPYVYDKAQGRLVIDPAKMDQAQRIWTMAETMSARAIARELKVPEIFVRRSISDERLLFCQALRLDPATAETLPCDWTPVLDADQAARIRAGRRNRKTGTGKIRAAGGLLSAMNLLYCGFCGRTAKTWTNSRIRTDGTRLDYYACNSRNSRTDCPQSRMIPQPELERRVIKNLFFTLRNIEELERFWLAHRDGGELEEEITSLGRQEEAERKKKTRLVEAVADGLLNVGDIKAKMREIEDFLEEIQQRRRTIREQITSAQGPDWQALSLTQEEFDLLTFQEQRAVLQSTIRRVSVFSGHAVIEYQFPRDANGGTQSRVNLPAPNKTHHKHLPKSFTK